MACHQQEIPIRSELFTMGGGCNAIPIWLSGEAKLAAIELAANPLGGELFERNSHRGCKLGRGKKLAAK